jgi:hypothetical protein
VPREEYMLRHVRPGRVAAGETQQDVEVHGRVHEGELSDDPSPPEGSLRHSDGVFLRRARIQTESFDTTSVRMKLAAMGSGRLPHVTTRARRDQQNSW